MPDRNMGPGAALAFTVPRDLADFLAAQGVPQEAAEDTADAVLRYRRTAHYHGSCRESGCLGGWGDETCIYTEVDHAE